MLPLLDDILNIHYIDYFPRGNKVTHHLLKIESVNNLGLEEIKKFIQDGFAYVRLPNDMHVKDELHALKNHALKFYNMPYAFKNSESTRLNPKKYKGYINRREDDKPIYHEQVFFRPDDPIRPFESQLNHLIEVDSVFWGRIAKPILHHIFQFVLKEAGFDKCTISELYNEATEKRFSSISFPYYPSPELQDKASHKYKYGLNPHKDQGIITVLWVNKPGLQVWLDDSLCNWIDVHPDENYVVVNIGNALRLILNDECKSSLHRVLFPTEERLSIAMFYDLSFDYNLRNLITNELCFDGSYERYLEDQFTKVYVEPVPEKDLIEERSRT